MKWQYAQAYVEALCLCHATKTRPKRKGLICKNDGSARAPLFLVHFSDFLCETCHKLSKVKVVRIMSVT